MRSIVLVILLIRLQRVVTSFLRYGDSIAWMRMARNQSSLLLIAGVTKMIRHSCSDRIDWNVCSAKHNHIQKLTLTTTVKAKNCCVASLFAPSYGPKVPLITSIRTVAKQTHFPIGIFRFDLVVVEQL